MAKSSPALRLTLIWLIAAEPVLDRVLDRDDVLLDLVDLLQRRVEGRRLARAGRAGDQDRAVGLVEGLLEALARRAVHAEVVERALRVVLVEDADRRPLAALGRQRGDAQVDAALLDRDADPAVLRHPLLGDVEVAHDLHPRDDRVDHPLRHVGRLAQHAVDPEADPHLPLAGLEVDVGGALPHRLAEDAVDELDHRRVFGADFHVGDLGQLVLGLRLALGDRLADRALQRVEAADQRLDVLLGGDRDAAVERGGDLDVVDREHVGRVGHRDQQRLLVDEADRQRPVAARGVDRDQVGGGHVDLVGGEVDVVEAVALGDRAGELVGVDRALLEQQLLGRAAGGARLLDRLAGDGRRRRSRGRRGRR